MEKRSVIVNGVEFTVEEQITARALKEQMGSSEEDQVFVKPADGKPHYRLEDEAILPPDTEQVEIIPAFCWE